MSDVDRLTTAIALGIILLLAAVVFGGLVSTADETVGTSQSGTVQRVPVPLDGTTFVDAPGSSGTDETVKRSTGFAVELTGAPDSQVTADSGALELASDTTWTACQFVTVNSTATSENMTALSADGRAIIGYNGSQGNWTAYVYDDGSRGSQYLTTDATNVTRYHHLCLTRNATDLQLYVNASVATTDTIDNDTDAEEHPFNNSNWHGVVEETRLWDDNLTSTEINTVYTSPTAYGPVQNRTGRIYYDAGSGSTVYLWFQSGDMTLSNGSWVQSAYGGTVMSDGSDYEWRDEGPEIRAVTGGRLEQAPVAWVDYDKFVSAVSVSVPTLGSALELGAVLILLLVAVTIYGRIKSL